MSASTESVPATVDPCIKSWYNPMRFFPSGDCIRKAELDKAAQGQPATTAPPAVMGGRRRSTRGKKSKKSKKSKTTKKKGGRR